MRPSSIYPNQRFGKLTTIKIDHRNERGDAFWETRCDCGRTHIGRSMHLRNGSLKSCGCMAAENRAKHMDINRAEARAIIDTLPLLSDGRYIAMTQGKILIVPPDTYDLMIKFNWTPIKPRHSWYACAPYGSGKDRKIILAHRLLMGFPEGEQIDHEDSFGLDCRWKNLRDASSSQNAANRGANKNRPGLAKGVYLDKERKKWRAVMCYLENGKKIYRLIGRFDEYDDACSVALKARIERYGEFARIL